MDANKFLRGGGKSKKHPLFVGETNTEVLMEGIFEAINKNEAYAVAPKVLRAAPERLSKNDSNDHTTARIL